jgi:hypothetical protein
LNRLVYDGWAKRNRYDDYQPATPEAMGMFHDDGKGLDRSKMMLQSLFTHFQPFLKAPDIRGYKTKATSPLIIQGGWVGDSYTKDRRDAR